MLPQSNESDKPTVDTRLLADAMLGKLARWLRLLGYDTTYAADWDDATIVRLARAEGRVILTRDRALSQRRGVRALYLASERLEQQVGQILEELCLPPAQAGTRCSVCNDMLHRVAKADLRERVPPYVFETQEVFRHCPTCDRIYWPGGHWARMQPVLRRLRAAGGRSPAKGIQLDEAPRESHSQAPTPRGSRGIEE
jgi:uncharacterized protein with PIN domain